MAERRLTDRLDETVDAILRRGDATGALRDRELAPLARVAADLRHYPSPDFKARLRAQLESQIERKPIMTTVAATPSVREGFSTVTPYIRVSQEGLVDFLTKVFDAEETFSGRGGGGGMHREVRIGDMLRVVNDGGDFQVEVLLLSEVRGPASVAQTLYRETEASREQRLKVAAEHKAMKQFEACIPGLRVFLPARDQEPSSWR